MTEMYCILKRIEPGNEEGNEEHEEKKKAKKYN